MSDKILNLHERNKTQDIIHDTEILIYVEGTDILLHRLHNKVIVSGSAFTAAKHFNIKPNIWTPTYNTKLGIYTPTAEPYTEPGIRKDEIVCLFAIGTDGCGQENSQVYDVNYTKWIAPENLIPFRYQQPTDDLNTAMRSKYFGRVATNSRIAYYFKKFESDPVFKQQYSDGTPIDENVYTDARLDEVESFVEISLKITKEDCRDFFLATTGINSARVNTISLLTGWSSVDGDGFTYYHDIRPLTKLNFPNESLIDTSKGLDIIYHIYY